MHYKNSLLQAVAVVVVEPAVIGVRISTTVCCVQYPNMRCNDDLLTISILTDPSNSENHTFKH